MATVVSDSEPDPQRLDVIRECMEHHDVGDPNAQWPNNLISRHAVAYSSGRIAVRDGLNHKVNVDELNLCRRLAAEIAAQMTGVSVGMGSDCDGVAFRGFYMAARIGEAVPVDIDEALIRSRFGGTIFPPATITVEPLTEGTDWWAAVEEDGEGSEQDDYFAPWRTMMQWFHQQSDVVSTAFVQIGNSTALCELRKEQFPPGTEIPGCVLPRLALGLTRGGSLVGLFGYTVQS